MYLLLLGIPPDAADELAVVLRRPQGVLWEGDQPQLPKDSERSYHNDQDVGAGDVEAIDADAGQDEDPWTITPAAPERLQ